MFTTGSHNINPGSINTAMPQYIRQFCNIFLNIIKSPCKQLTQIMRKHLARRYTSRFYSKKPQFWYTYSCTANGFQYKMKLWAIVCRMQKTQILPLCQLFFFQFKYSRNSSIISCVNTCSSISVFLPKYISNSILLLYPLLQPRCKIPASWNYLF